MLAPLLQSDAEIFERCVIGVESASIRRIYSDVLRRQIQNLPKLCFLFADFFFRNFALLDFYTRAVPLDDLSRFVAQWFFTMKEPAIFPVSPPHARLANERLSGFKRRAPLGTIASTSSGWIVEVQPHPSKSVKGRPTYSSQPRL